MNIILKRSVRAKRTSIKIRQGQVILTVAKRGCVDSAYRFLDSHLNLLQKRLAGYTPINFSDGTKLRLLGKEYTIIHSKSIQLKNIMMNGDQLIISAGVKNLEDIIVKFLSNYLKQTILIMAPGIAEEIGVSYSRISVKKMHSKWGSCSSSGNLSFCWKLVFFDENILKYIVVHEICHLKEMNHSKNFWALVESLYPDWRKARMWLKDEGARIL